MAQPAPATDESAQQTPSAEQVRETIENVFSHIWTPRSRYTDGPYTRGAFRPVVATSREATAQVRCEGKRVAYGGVVGPDGWILTKASQLRGAIVVRLLGGQSYPARIVGVDRDYDLAMLKVEASGLTTLDLSGGPPLDERQLVRADREVEASDENGVEPSEETEASSSQEEIAAVDPIPLYPGDWVATVGYGRDPAAIGVVSVLPRKIERRRGILGIRMKPDPQVDPRKRLLKQLNGEDSSDEDLPKSSGVVVDRVYDDTGASRAGVKAGDIIVAVDGQPVTTNAEVSDAIRVHYPGDEVVVTLKRDDKTLKLRAVLTGEVRDFGVSRSQYQNSLGGKLSGRRFGFPLALQHDTVLRPEDCGGPLVDLEGRVVGFNIARAGRTETYALPTQAVRERLYDLMSGRLAPSDPTAADPPAAETDTSDAG